MCVSLSISPSHSWHHVVTDIVFVCIWLDLKSDRNRADFIAAISFRIDATANDRIAKYFIVEIHYSIVLKMWKFRMYPVLISAVLFWCRKKSREKCYFHRKSTNSGLTIAVFFESERTPANIQMVTIKWSKNRFYDWKILFRFFLWKFQYMK